MHSLNNLPMEFPYPNHVKTVVCCDLDETYIPFNVNKKSQGGVEHLETFMCNEGSRKGMLLGWITGSNLKSVLKKSYRYINRSPSFICCSLGTEFYWVKKGKLIFSKSWKQRIIESGYDRDKIFTLVELAKRHGIELTAQPDDYQGDFKISFYYKYNEKMQADFDWLKEYAFKVKSRVLFTKCNPAAGDPENCYDVEFIPTCCGKDETVSFITDELGISYNSIYAFGDSCNDFPMFAKSGHSYLVSNADPAAVELHGDSLKEPYCHGILSILKEL